MLLTEKYDDLKVQAILNEINGGISHSNAGLSNLNHVEPAIFGMNFQAVSVAQKYKNGGIVLLPDGSTAPSAVLEAAMQHTDASIGKIVAALEARSDPQGGGTEYQTTEIYLMAKHGQDPRVNPAGLMADSTLPNLLNNAGATVAQATQDNVSLIWLQDQSTLSKAVTALQNFQQTGTIDVYFQGTKTTLPASTVINQILYGPSLVNAGLGNPATDATTPDIIVTLKPGYIWVGNPKNFSFKRAEHGGFTEDSTHVALIVSGGVLPHDVRGTTVSLPVQLKQVAVSTLNALGLDAGQLQGAVIEGTKALPGLTAPVKTHFDFKADKSSQVIVGSFFDVNPVGPITGFKVSVDFGDNTGPDTNVFLVREGATSANIVDIYASHTYAKPGTYDGTVTIITPTGRKITESFTVTVTSKGKKASLSHHAVMDQAFAQWDALPKDDHDD
jgi:hypothetical protein